MQYINKKFNGIEYGIREDMWAFWKEYMMGNIMVYYKNEITTIEILPEYGTYSFGDITVQGVVNMANNAPDDLLSMILNTTFGIKYFSQIYPSYPEQRYVKKKTFWQRLFS